jgi:hypothetical protein
MAWGLPSTEVAVYRALTVVLPTPREAGLPFRHCAGCRKRSSFVIAGLYAECVALEMGAFGSMPVARGLCWQCSRRGALLHIVSRGGGYIEGMWGSSWSQEKASMRAGSARQLEEQSKPDFDSRGLGPGDYVTRSGSARVLASAPFQV